MPLTLTLTEGVLPAGSEKDAVARLTDTMMKRHGLTGNKVMTPNVTAIVHVLPKGSPVSSRMRQTSSTNSRVASSRRTTST